MGQLKDGRMDCIVQLTIGRSGAAGMHFRLLIFISIDICRNLLMLLMLSIPYCFSHLSSPGMFSVTVPNMHFLSPPPHICVPFPIRCRICHVSRPLIDLASTHIFSPLYASPHFFPPLVFQRPGPSHLSPSTRMSGRLVSCPVCPWVGIVCLLAPLSDCMCTIVLTGRCS
jgi:hypothetical protein